MLAAGVAPPRAASASPPEAAQEAGDGVEHVGAIEIIGNARTSPSVIVDAARVRSGDSIDSVDIPSVRQRVLNLKLFETVDVEQRPGPTPRTTDLVIRVKERWTLFPIPFVSSSSRGTQAGVLVLESNLFGKNKLVAAGASYASFGGIVFAFYKDPAVAGSRYQFAANASYAKIVRERRDGEDVVFQYDDQRVQLGAGVGYQWTRWLSTSVGWFATHADASGRPAFPAMLPAGGLIHGWTVDAQLTATDFKQFYDEGFAAMARYRHGVEALGAARDVVDVTARAQYTRALIGEQSTSVAVQADYIDGDPLLDVRLLGGRAGARGFDTATLWADRAVIGTLEHQVPVVRLGWGIWTANAFVDAGQVGYRGATTRFVNPGVGLRLYLSRMSFPALGADVSYSLEDERALVTGSVGFSM